MCDRYEYVSIKDRHAYTWPNGSKLAVFLALNVEIFTFDDESNIGLIGDQPAPYVAAYGWKDYGNRYAARSEGPSCLATVKVKGHGAPMITDAPHPLFTHLHARVAGALPSWG